jgi:hypothetical protein
MEKLREKAAGIDIGSRKVFVSIEGSGNAGIRKRKIRVLIQFEGGIQFSHLDKVPSNHY